jgi:hypothetical protein
LSPTARIFQTTAAGLRSAGFQTCCVADFQVGKTNGSHTGSGFGNPRHSRLGSPRYLGCGLTALSLCVEKLAEENKISFHCYRCSFVFIRGKYF